MTQGPGQMPQQPGTPPPPAGWAPPTAPAPVAGPAGLVYADVPNRAIAYIIDAILLAIINIVIATVLDAIGLKAWTVDLNATTIGGLVNYNPIVGLLLAVIYAAIGAVYFIYTWTAMRGTPGMKVLGMQIGNAANGATITMEQGIKRWIALGAPFAIAQALNPLPSFGILIGLAAFAWFIALLYTTAVSPTKQGIHDKFAETIVAKAARTVG